MSLHVILLYPHGAQERGSTGSVYGLCCCRAVSAAVRPLCAVGLSGSCQAVTLGPDSDGTPRLSDSAVRLSDTRAVRLSEKVLSALSGCVGHCQALSGVCCQAVGPGLSGPRPLGGRSAYRLSSAIAHGGARTLLPLAHTMPSFSFSSSALTVRNSVRVPTFSGEWLVGS